MDKLLNNLKKGVQVAVNEAEKLTKAVADKTSNIVDVTKLNLSLSETERKINKLYCSIGEAVYADYENGDEPSSKIADMCAEIDELKSEVSGIKEQLASVKDSIACPSCGQYNDKSSGYCSKCGQKLSEEKEEDMVIEVTDLD